MAVQNIILIFAIFVSIALAQRSPACPTPPPECTTNPCENATCPHFTSQLRCCPELYKGVCTARFYRQNSRKPVGPPEICTRNVIFCKDVECNGRRMCVEKEILCNLPNCDTRTVVAKCVPIKPLPVANCDQVYLHHSLLL